MPSEIYTEPYMEDIALCKFWRHILYMFGKRVKKGEESNDPFGRTRDTKIPATQIF